MKILNWYLTTVSDASARYGEAFRRAVVRNVCHTQESITLYMLVLREQDPTLTCCRRVKGQMACPELSCSMCHLDSLNLTSSPAHYGVGGAADLVVLRLKMFDRHRILSREHGICTPADVDWREMALTDTGKTFVVLSGTIKSLLLLQNRPTFYNLFHPSG